MTEIVNIEKRPLYNLIVDSGYQRNLSESRAEKIAKDFVPALAGVIEVAERPDGTLAVIDGQHRLMAMRKLGITEWWVKVSKMTPNEEAEIFVKLQTERKPINPYDRHRALLVAKDEAALSIETVLRELNLKFVPRISPRDSFNTTAGGVRSIGAVYKTYQHGGIDHLRKVMTTPLLAWPEENTRETYHQHIVHGLDRFYRNYPQVNPRDLIPKLSLISYAKLIRDAAALAPVSGDSPSAMSSVLLSIYNRGRRSGRVMPVQKGRNGRPVLSIEETE